jgi:hypothetical protein
MLKLKVLVTAFFATNSTNYHEFQFVIIRGIRSKIELRVIENKGITILLQVLSSALPLPAGYDN